MRELFKRNVFWFAIDTIILLIATSLSYFFLYPMYYIDARIVIYYTAVAMFISCQLFSMIYRLSARNWSYASIEDLLAIIKVVTFAIIGTGIVQYMALKQVRIRLLFLVWLISITGIGGTRLFQRILHEYIQRRNKFPGLRTLIIGAGEGGKILAGTLKRHPESNIEPIGFLDDSDSKQYTYIHELPIFGRIEDLPQIVKQERVEQITIAIPSIEKKRFQEILNLCLDTGISTKIMPPIEDVLSGKIAVQRFRNVDVEDLLGREPVTLDDRSIGEVVEDKTVLVTGAGGSIGSELCRQLIQFYPKKLVLLGHGENSIYLIEKELHQLQQSNSVECIPVIGDIQDRSRLDEIFSEHRPDVVYHAAAHKHVPLMECNPKEAIKNNIFGTKNVAEACVKWQVKSMVTISSDKAVNPPNVMGATKRVTEMVIQSYNTKSETKFVAVRFGNVLGSRGSVIPLFKEQIANGGPITITDKRMTRYFMTIPEAAQLVIQAGALARGGEIFVLDMGEPVKILDLAKNMIRLSGLSEGDIDIKEVGIRPGEKLFEELLNDEEHVDKQIFPKIFIGKVLTPNKQALDKYLTEIINVSSEEAKIRTLALANQSISKG